MPMFKLTKDFWHEKKAHQFKVGGYPWLSAEDNDLQLSSEKLGDRQLGPSKIIEQVGPLRFQLNLSLSLSQIHNVFHVNKLYPWRGNSVNNYSTG
jgi:hypothetical protein